MSTHTTRTAVLWVPDWPVVAGLAVAGLGSHVPAAVLGGSSSSGAGAGTGQRLVAVSAVARAAGVRRGMRRRQAQERCPDLVLLPVDDGRDAREFEPVAVAAETVVAGLEIARPGLVLLPADGAARYHGSEEALAQALVEQVADRTGHECQVGVADGFLAAVLAARESHVVPPGGSRAYLAPRPVGDLLHASTVPGATRSPGETVPGGARPASGKGIDVGDVAELTDLWRRLGLHTLGDLAALPEASVLARFGAAGTWAHRLACGEDVRPPARRRIEGELTAGQELDPPATRVDVATFAARRLADDLHHQLASRGLACGRLRITARAVDPVSGDARTLERLWRVDDGALGGLTAARITDRVRWQLEGWLTASAVGRARRAREHAGVNAPDRFQDREEAVTRTWKQSGAHPEDQPALEIAHLALTAEEVAPAGVLQPRLWGPSAGEDLRARRALERVQGLLGGDAVLTLQVQGGRDPRDRVHLVPFGEEAPPAREPGRPWPGALPPPGPSLVLPEPVPAVVIDAEGRPVVVSSRLALSGAPARVRVEAPPGAAPASARDLACAVVDWAGPWPVAERWWSVAARRRVFLQVVSDDGRGLLLSATAGVWSLEALYD